MGFLNQAVLKQKSADAAVGKHPLLQEGGVPQNVRQSYLQGCVLAVLERDNGEISPTARQEVARLGKSLELSDSDVNESISIVTDLNSPEDQGQFLEELFSTLSEARYARYFLCDFENHLRKNGQLSDDAKKTFDMFKDALARNSVSSHHDGMKGGSCVGAKQNHPVSAGWANRPNYEIRAHIRAIPMQLNIPEWNPVDNSVGSVCLVYSPDAYTIFVEPIIIDPTSNNWIENAEERQAAIRKDCEWNRYLQCEDFFRYIRETLQTAIPGVKPVFVGNTAHWSLPDCEYRTSMSALPCGYNMQGDELGRYICKGFCCDNKAVAWDEPIHEFDLPNGLSWTGLGLDSEEDEYSEIERVFGRDGFEVDLTSFKKGERMRFPDGRIQEIKTYGDVYRYFSEHCEFA